MVVIDMTRPSGYGLQQQVLHLYKLPHMATRHDKHDHLKLMSPLSNLRSPNNNRPISSCFRTAIPSTQSFRPDAN